MRHHSILSDAVFIGCAQHIDGGVGGGILITFRDEYCLYSIDYEKNVGPSSATMFRVHMLRHKSACSQGVSADILRVLLRVQNYLRCPLGWDPVTCGRLAVILAGYKVLSAFPCLLAMAVQYRQACGKAFRGVTSRIFRFTIVVNRSSGRFEFPADLLSGLSHPTLT